MDGWFVGKWVGGRVDGGMMDVLVSWGLASVSLQRDN